MKLIWFETIDSTSAEAARRVHQPDHKAPFAVAADKQSAGRGQRGRQWQSPAGNIYLSIAIPVSDQRELVRMPLFTGLVIAEWLQETFGLPATLKWPNDVLVYGRKLAGVLCECPVQGDSFGPAIIGIGLNVGSPPTDLPTGMQATGVKDVVGPTVKVPAVQDLVRDFLSFWQVQWPNFADTAAWMGRYRELMIQPGHILVSEQGTLASIRGVDEDGALNLWEGGQEKILHSAAETWRWHLQAHDRFVVADVGNTAVKLGSATLKAKHVEVRTALPFLLGEPIPDACLPLVKQGNVVYAMSVNPAGLKKLEDQLNRLGVIVIPLRKRRLRTEGEYPIDQLGIDRLAACEAYAARYPGDAGIVVSCGTAVTVDVIEEDGTHLGGWIVPGLQTALNAMNKSTAQLPSVTLTGAGFALQLGNSSASAMRSGVKASIVGLVKEARKFVSEDARIVLTGGYADEIASALPGCAVEPSLLLEGAACLALAGL